MPFLQPNQQRQSTEGINYEQALACKTFPLSVHDWFCLLFAEIHHKRKTYFRLSPVF